MATIEHHPSETTPNQYNTLAFDRRNRQHIQALANFANGLLIDFDQNREPMRFTIQGIRMTERELQLSHQLAPINQLGRPIIALKIDFTLPLESD